MSIRTGPRKVELRSSPFPGGPDCQRRRKKPAGGAEQNQASWAKISRWAMRARFRRSRDRRAVLRLAPLTSPPEVLPSMRSETASLRIPTTFRTAPTPAFTGHTSVKSQVELRAAYMPDAARAAFRATPELVPGDGSAPWLRHRLIAFRHFIDGLLALASRATRPARQARASQKPALSALTAPIISR
jgi:hypothetical protein